jgi:MFS transporter, DHA1 family, tetracycline resistance protein
MTDAAPDAAYPPMSDAPAPVHVGAQPPIGPDRQAAMPFIMLTVLIDMAAIGLIVPVLPSIVGSFTTSQADQAWWYGAVSTAFGFANFFGAPILGALSDRYGRRPVLLLGFCGLAFTFFATALATALWMLIVARLIGGAMQANAAVCNAYVADITPPELRAKRFGLLGAMFGVGFIIGPVAGGLLGAINLRLPFYVAGGLSLLNLAYGYLVLPESLAPDKRRPFRWSATNPITSLTALTRLGRVGPLVAVVGFSMLAQYVLFTSWVLYTTFKFGWGPQENGWSLAAVGIVSVIVQGFLLGALLKRFSTERLVVWGLISATLANVGYGLATEGWMMYAIVFLNLLGFTTGASIQSLISAGADASKQGSTMGSIASLGSLMAVMAPVFGAPLLGLVSHYPRGDWRIGAPFYFCGLLMAISLTLAVRHFARTSAPTA